MFLYHGNRGRSEKFLTVTFKQADPQTLYWVQVHGLCLLSKASYSQFCVEICDFLYHGNRVGLSNFLLTHAYWLYPITLP